MSPLRRFSFRCYSGTTNASGRVLAGKWNSNARKCEKLWLDLFSDPSRWWDNRLGKPNPRFPDFKHKQTGEGLWVIDGRNPQWVASEIDSIAPELSLVSRSQSLSTLNKAGQYDKTIEYFEQMQQEGVISNCYVLVHVLKACTALRDLSEGRRIHRRILETDVELNLYVSNCLVDMYAKCGSIDEAWKVFNKMAFRDVVAWNAMILGSANCGEGLKALELFQRMQREGFPPDSRTFVGLLKACARMMALEEGRRVHEEIVRSGFESDIYIVSSLVDMYSKCGKIDEAWRVFNAMPGRHDVVVWNALILGCVNCGEGLKALQLFQQMQKKGIEPTSVTFVGSLKACASIAAIEDGRRVHAQIIRSGFESVDNVASSLVDMYAKCGSIDEAWRVFSKITTSNVVAWNAMILGCVKCGEALKAVHLFRQMQNVGVEPNAVTFVGLLNACSSAAALEQGRCVHELIIRSGFECDVYVANCLIDMYAKCGRMDEARRLFNKMEEHDVATWNVMILGCANCGQGWQALQLFQLMERNGVEPNFVTFVGLLKACARIGALEQGRYVHEQTIWAGFESVVYVVSSLVDMYAKCGSIEEAWRVFNKIPTRDVVTWNAMILGFVKYGEGSKALLLFEQMQTMGVEPNSVTFVGVLKACASLGSLEEGKRIHALVIRSGLESVAHVVCTLVDMYSQCENIDEAWRVFNKTPSHDVVSWNAMILGCVKCGAGSKALKLFQQMQENGVEPNARTFVGVLNACSSIAALEEGRRIHSQIIQRGFEGDIYVGNSLVAMYAKCGNIDEAWREFSKRPIQNVVSWTAMIMGYAMHGYAKEAVALFERMVQAGSEINEVTFICLLSGCSHGGLVKESVQYFKDMWSVYGVTPIQEHYTCMVDILGRAGHLDDAEAMVITMPLEPCAATWMALLGACRIHGNVEMGERASKRVLELDSTKAAGYVLLSNIYAGDGNYKSKAMVQEQGLKKGVIGDLPDFKIFNEYSKYQSPVCADFMKLGFEAIL